MSKQITNLLFIISLVFTNGSSYIRHLAIHYKFSGAPPKYLCWQAEDNFSWLPPGLPGFVNAVDMVVRGNWA